MLIFLFNLLYASGKWSAIHRKIHIISCSGHILVAHVCVQVLLGQISRRIMSIFSSIIIDVPVDKEVLVDRDIVILSRK